MSENAQKAEYVFLSDADDTLTPNALQRLYEEAEKNDLDCVCASMEKMWKNVVLHSKHKAPCFEPPKVYTQKEIMDELYISCFGITNYPVNLVAKLYRTELITKTIDFEPVVRFMGEDLSVTLRIMPETQRLGIIPDVVYHYRIGGNTSRYMPYMLEDFLSLYRFKTDMRRQHPMPQDAEYYMAVELMNVLKDWYKMYRQQGKHTNEELVAEIARTASLTEVEDARRVLRERGKTHMVAGMLEKEEYEQIAANVEEMLKKDAPKRMLKSILYAL